MASTIIHDPLLQWQAWCQTEGSDSQGVSSRAREGDWLKTTNLLGMGRYSGLEQLRSLVLDRGAKAGVFFYYCKSEASLAGPLPDGDLCRLRFLLRGKMKFNGFGK